MTITKAKGQITKKQYFLDFLLQKRTLKFTLRSEATFGHLVVNSLTKICFMCSSRFFRF